MSNPSPIQPGNLVTNIQVWSNQNGKVKAEGMMNGKKVTIEAQVPKNFDTKNLTQVLNDSFIEAFKKTRGDEFSLNLKNRQYSNIKMTLRVATDLAEPLLAIQKEKMSLNRMHKATTSTQRALQFLKDAYADSHTAVHDFARMAEKQVKNFSVTDAPFFTEHETKFKLIKDFCVNPKNYKNYSLESDPLTNGLRIVKGTKGDAQTLNAILTVIEKQIDDHKSRTKSDNLTYYTILSSLSGVKFPYQDIIENDQTIQNRVTELILKITNNR